MRRTAPPPPVRDDVRDDARRRTLRGTGIVRGEAQGRARRVERLDAALLDELGPDDVLVLPSEQAFAYADWHSLLTVVRGVVSVGRPAHHLTQVARECGVPIVGFLPSVDGIEDGAEIRIDGGSGAVDLAEPLGEPSADP
jgi:phosphohistidine swiveling domain-containing protein